MTKQIIVEVAPNGSIKIDSVGFKGVECEKATKFLEDVLGVVGERKKSSEFYQSERTKQ